MPHLPGEFHVLEIRRHDVPQRPERVDGVPQLRCELDGALHPRDGITSSLAS